MELDGHNLVGDMPTRESTQTFRAANAATGASLDPVFHEATAGDVDTAFTGAAHAFRVYGELSAAHRARFLRAIADEIVALGAQLIERAHVETALPTARLEGERARTVGQLRLFADCLDEGSWVEARIDIGDATRTPLPKPDLRRMLIPLGPVAIFGASNFPLAFSVPGGDTASALASGCTVVFKAHPAHPGTSELAARAIQNAARTTDVPAGVFSLLHGWAHDVGLAMVRHPHATAVGFTGSLRGGRALYDAAAARPSPIPVFAELGSINPVFLLPSAAAERGEAIAQGLAQAITMGVGQFCTNPGTIIGVGGQALDTLTQQLAARIDAADAGVMLYSRLALGYANGLARATAKGVSVLSSAKTAPSTAHAQPALLQIDAVRFLEDRDLHEEVFGPVSLVVVAKDAAELMRVADSLDGQLTATIHGTDDELREHAPLVQVLQRKVGRLLFNGYPTGVEVGHAMQHGGPYPASTDSRSTSVGSAAITRFARPICFQNFPDGSLPAALQGKNALGIWRLVNGSLSKGDV